MKKLLLALCLLMLSTPCHALTWQSGYSPTTLTWQQAVSYCDSLTHDYSTDWRLPTRAELLTLVDYARANPASTVSLPTSAPFWSSTEQAYNESTKAWFIYFSYGISHHAAKTVKGFAKCVSGEPMTTPDYTDNGDGTVSDNTNHLMWQKAISGMVNNYRDAAMYCFFSNTGWQSDWRLPTIQELLTTVDETKWCATSLDPLEGVYGMQWSSTVQVVRTYDFLPYKVDYGYNLQWIVTNSGCTGFSDQTNYPYQVLGDPGRALYARCVRSLPYVAPTPEPTPTPTPDNGYTKPRRLDPSYSGAGPRSRRR